MSCPVCVCVCSTNTVEACGTHLRIPGYQVMKRTESTTVMSTDTANIVGECEKSGTHLMRWEEGETSNI